MMHREIGVAAADLSDCKLSETTALQFERVGGRKA